TSLQQPLRVFRYPVPSVTDPNVERTRTGIPTTSSVTSWTRLEPVATGADIGLCAAARLLDPLWSFTRQWQLGEFQAEDTGSPVRARVRAPSTPLSRLHLGPLAPGSAAAVPYDPARTPLEAIVERRPAGPSLTVAVDAGLHFLRMLELDPVGKKY